MLYVSVECWLRANVFSTWRVVALESGVDMASEKLIVNRSKGVSRNTTLVSEDEQGVQPPEDAARI